MPSPTEEEKGIVSLMGEKRVFPPPKELSKKAHIKSLDQYKEIYQRSIDDLQALVQDRHYPQ